jgi:hypothetical protein
MQSSENEDLSVEPEREHDEYDEGQETRSDSSSVSNSSTQRAPAIAAPPQHHPTRYLQVETAMSALFPSLIESNKFTIVVWTGDVLVRDDAVRFHRDDLPSWTGI